MPELDANPPSDVAAVRAAMLIDLAPIEVFAKAMDRSIRTIQRLIAQRKIPIVTIGRTSYVVISGAREAVMSGARSGHAVPKRGRPTGRKAA